eukprot:GILI01021412.1.p1 GENE.GILI01021412.1~~GILI01021412.1.p1  ORF type:complete len:227 (+),score=46.00 GILI01021412.1:64-744(+)
MSDDDGEVLSPHQASIRHREAFRGTEEARKRINALRQQVTKYDAVAYQRAQLEYAQKEIKLSKEESKEQEAEYMERKALYVAQNVELANAVKENKKQTLFDSRKRLAAARTGTYKERREEGERNGEYLQAFGDDDSSWRRELHDKIVSVQKEEAAQRAKDNESRAKAFKAESETFVAKRKEEYDEETVKMANLILKEARILRQLAKLREAEEKERAGEPSADAKEV